MAQVGPFYQRNQYVVISQPAKTGGAKERAERMRDKDQRVERDSLRVPTSSSDRIVAARPTNPPLGAVPCSAKFWPVPPSGLFSYESEKQSWISAHPEATPAEYERAMQRIAKRCEV